MYPDGASARRSFPVSVDPDPRSRANGVVSLDPDMKPARTGRARDDDLWRRRWGAADLNFLDDNGAGTIGYDNTAGHKDNRNKTRAAQEILHTVHNLLLPSTHNTFNRRLRFLRCISQCFFFPAGGSYPALTYLRHLA